MCKWRESLSKRVLIGRGLDPIFDWYFICWKQFDIQFWRYMPSKKEKLTLVREWPVSMTVRNHLFPFRTQKLSSLVPKIVGWKRPVKIGRCRLLLKSKQPTGRAESPVRGFALLSTISSVGSVINSHLSCEWWTSTELFKLRFHDVSRKSHICTISSVGRATDS